MHIGALPPSPTPPPIRLHVRPLPWVLYIMESVLVYTENIIHFSTQGLIRLGRLASTTTLTGCTPPPPSKWHCIQNDTTCAPVYSARSRLLFPLRLAYARSLARCQPSATAVPAHSAIQYRLRNGDKIGLTFMENYTCETCAHAHAGRTARVALPGACIRLTIPIFTHSHNNPPCTPTRTHCVRK